MIHFWGRRHTSTQVANFILHTHLIVVRGTDSIWWFVWCRYRHHSRQDTKYSANAPDAQVTVKRELLLSDRCDGRWSVVGGHTTNKKSDERHFNRILHFVFLYCFYFFCLLSSVFSVDCFVFKHSSFVSIQLVLFANYSFSDNLIRAERRWHVHHAHAHHTHCSFAKFFF